MGVPIRACSPVSVCVLEGLEQPEAVPPGHPPTWERSPWPDSLPAATPGPEHDISSHLEHTTCPIP